MTENKQKDKEPITVKWFFEAIPPGEKVEVKGVANYEYSVTSPRLNLPDLQLFCETDMCDGVRSFEAENTLGDLENDGQSLLFVVYCCRNCRKTTKVFSISVTLGRKAADGTMYKLGEIPPFGPPTPARLITLIGPDKDYFLKGRRSENQGLGIAAFTYYRRVVENQKNRILDEIIRVAEKVNASQEVIDDFKKAKEETQFSKSVESIKHAIPQVLLINGQNPLKLLHSALSEGVHDLTDEECLELATSIRVVLTELAERLSQALKEEAELSDAVTRLMERKRK